MLLDPELMKKFGVFGLVSGEVLGAVLGGYFFGQFIDRKAHTTPAFTAIFACVGLIYSVWRILQISKKWFRDGPNSDIAKDKE